MRPRDPVEALLRRLYPLLTAGQSRADMRPDADAALVALLAGMLAFGFALTNPTPGFDDYIFLAERVRLDEFWIARGMWGGLVVQYLTPSGWITPFIPLVVGVVLQVLTAVFIGWMLLPHRVGWRGRALAYSAFVTFPYFAEQMSFAYLQIAYPLASLLVVAGVLVAVSGGGVQRLLLAAVAMAFGISIYQGVLSLLLTVAPLAVVARSLWARSPGSHDLRPLLDPAFRVGAALGAGVLSYLAVHRLVLALTSAVPTSEYYSVSFQPEFWERWSRIAANISDLTLGLDGMVPLVALVALAVCSGLLLVDWIRARPEPLVVGAVVAASLGALIGPFWVLLFHAGDLAARSSLGIAIWYFLAFAWAASASIRWAGRVGATFAVIAIVAFVFQVNRLFYSQHLIAQADLVMVSRIAERIDLISPATDGQPPVVIAVGSYDHPDYPSILQVDSPMANSQFSRYSNVYRIQYLARFAGVDRYVWRPAESLGDSQAVDLLVGRRQPWPSSESVFIDDERVIVWLGAEASE